MYKYIVCYKPALTLCTLKEDLDRINHKDRLIRPTLADLSLPIHNDNDNDNDNDRSGCSSTDDNDDDDDGRCHKHPTTTTTTTSAAGNEDDPRLPGNESQQQQQKLDLLRQRQQRQRQRQPLHIVGRLDRNSEGLLLLTNDGQFTARVLSPQNNCTKRYWALVESMCSTKTRTRYRGGAAAATPTSVESALQEMRAGGLPIRGAVTLPPRSVRILAHDEIQAMGLPAPVLGMDECHPTTTATTTAATAGFDDTRPHTMWLEFVLQEGKNRQVRRITADAGYKTLRLVRVAIGALELQTCRRYYDMKDGSGDKGSMQQKQQQQHQASQQLQPGQWMYIDKSDVLVGGGV